tara:strand:+ start:57 stop:428 length:372 start_codon:yes stop_codon:yes gene_type:complete
MNYIIILISLFFFQTNAIEPDEILEDENLEIIAREIGKELRCLVCQNEDIQNSNADIAKDLRKIVRIKLSNGESKKEIINYIHSRYGDFVLFSPPLRIDTFALWALPLLFFFLFTFLVFRKRK